jgi:hypothetical protein
MMDEDSNIMLLTGNEQSELQKEIEESDRSIPPQEVEDMHYCRICHFIIFEAILRPKSTQHDF